MKKNYFKLASIALMLFFNYSLNAQTFEWAKSSGGTTNDFGYSITVDASGNVYTTGVFQGTVDFDPGAGTNNLTSAGGQDVFVQKLDAAGNFLWAKSFGGISTDEGRSITIDASGNVYTTGHFQGAVDFDPGAGTNNLTSAGNVDVFVQKLDASGNFLWAKSFGGTTNDFGLSITVDASGNVYTTGSFYGTADFDPGTGFFNLTTIGSQDVFVQKLDASGNFLWAKSFGGTTNDFGLSITVDASGNVYTTGSFYGTADFDPGTGFFNLTTIGSQDVFVQKLDASGNFLWAKSFGGSSTDYGYSITVDASGNVYATGNFQGTVDFDPGAGTNNLTSAGSYDVFVQKLDASGNFLWAKSFGGSSTDYGYSITVDASGNVYTTGYFKGTADFDPGAGTNNHTSAGSQDVFVHKMSQCSPVAPIPDIANLPNLIGECSVAAPTAPTANDGCGTSFTGTTTTTFPITTQGTTVVTWTYDDGNGNVVTQDQNVVITDVTNPVADVSTLAAITDECAVASISAPTATDNCAGTITGTTTTTFPITIQGTTVVTWTYDDGNGNVVTQDQNVVITDVTDPVADLATLAAITDECAVASITAPTAADNCAGSITGTTTTTFPITAQGTTVVTWTYDDGNGNIVTQDQNVVITDVTDPVADVATLAAINAVCEINTTDAPAPTASDNCAGSITATPDVTFPITNQSTTQIVWTYDDGNGNTVTQNQAINWTPMDVSTTINGTEITANNTNGTYQWLDCDDNNALIPGETNVSYTATVNGGYAVEITENGCVDTSACVMITTVGIEENNFGASFKVYPNPTDGNFVIDLGTVYVSTEVTITDMSGKLLDSKTLTQSQVLNLSIEEPAGVYIVSVRAENKKAVIRLIKE